MCICVVCCAALKLHRQRDCIETNELNRTETQNQFQHIHKRNAHSNQAETAFFCSFFFFSRLFFLNKNVFLDNSVASAIAAAVYFFPFIFISLLILFFFCRCSYSLLFSRYSLETAWSTKKKLIRRRFFSNAADTFSSCSNFFCAYI